MAGMLLNTPMRANIALISAGAKCLVLCLWTVCVCGSIAAGNQATERTIQDTPPDVLLVVTNASEVRRSGLGRIVSDVLDGLPADPPISASWTALATELGYAQDELFDRLLGDGFALFASSAVQDRGARAAPDPDAATHWALVARISNETYQRLRERLKPAPRAVVGSTQILSLERGRYELAVRIAEHEPPAADEQKHTAPTPAHSRRSTPSRALRADTERRGVEIVLGASDRPAVFDRLVRGTPATGTTRNLGDHKPQRAQADWRDLGASVIRGMDADGCTIPSIHLLSGSSGLGLLASPLVHGGQTIESDRTLEWPAMRVSLDRVDAGADLWTFASIVRRQVPECADAAPNLEGTWACMAPAWSAGTLLSVHIPAGFSVARFTRTVSLELLRQIGLSELIDSDRRGSDVLAVRLDAPSGPDESIEGEEAATPPTFSLLLRLARNTDSERTLERAIAAISGHNQGPERESPAAALLMRAAALAPSATRTVAILDNDPASIDRPAPYIPTITWSILPNDTRHDPSDAIRSTLAVVTYSPTGDASSLESTAAMHRALRACGRTPPSDEIRVEPRWRVRARPSDLERLLSPRLDAWRAARSALAGIAEIDLTFQPVTPTPDPADPRQVGHETRGAGTIRFTPPNGGDPEPAGTLRPKSPDR